uniref:Myb-like domain-containing protein n=1 Tax=Leersia perrieri TaxID=77586 RepID=A0A0D9W7P8_9ORYZ
MQQQQHGGGGSQYGAVPTDMGPFSPTSHASAAPLPLSSRPPPPPAVASLPQQQQPRTSYDELAGLGGFPDVDDMLGDAGGSGGGGGSGSAGNRWPREETLALIRIRSEMDATFRDATLKGPLWEEVSRKLAELGYKRNAKKCKEKFENVHKYYKRTKEGRAGRQDGKSYRFFSELEALHAAAPPTPTPQPHQIQQQQQLPPVSSSGPAMHSYAPPPPMGAMPPPTGPIQPAPISSAAPAVAPLELPPQPPINLQGLSFSSMSGSESDEESEDDEMTAETGGSLGKRKRGGSAGGGKRLATFFEGLIKQVVDRQEEMQRRFLETMEKREAERTAREEAWRRQEVARLNREQEQLAQERAAAASRDAAIISFLQRIGGQSVQVQAPPPVAATVIQMPTPVQLQTPPPAKQPARQQHQPQPTPTPTPPPPPPQAPIPAAPLQQQPPQQKETTTTTTHHEAVSVTPRSAPPTSGSSLEVVPAAAETNTESGSASSSRWPKTEVNALIQLRMELDMRYQETGPKGPLWEDISAGMRRLGYNRSSKRCKEKWENINKYYKKVKESNKKRPEDSKTCPYFHQLDAIYRRKHLTGGVGVGASVANVAGATPATAAAIEQQNPNRHEIEGKHINDNDKRNNGGGGGAAQVPTSNGDTAPTAATFDVDSGMKKLIHPIFTGVFRAQFTFVRKLTGYAVAVKPEDIVRELSEHPPPREFTTDETDSDDMGDDYTDDGEEGEDDGKMQYRIQFQRPNPGGANTAPPPATTAVPTSTPTSTFLAMVQ